MSKDSIKTNKMDMFIADTTMNAPELKALLVERWDTTTRLATELYLARGNNDYDQRGKLIRELNTSMENAVVTYLQLQSGGEDFILKLTDGSFYFTVVKRHEFIADPAVANTLDHRLRTVKEYNSVTISDLEKAILHIYNSINFVIVNVALRDETK